MNQGTQNQTYGDEPVFTSPPEERQRSMGRPPQQQATTSTFGAPPMGEPSEPSAHQDNMTAATYTAGAAPEAAAAPVQMGGPNPSQMFLNRSQSSSAGALEKPLAGGGGGGLRRQASGAYDASTATKTDKGFFSGATQHSAPQQQPAPQPGGAGPTPVGVKPGSPYVQTQEVPSTGTSPMNQILEDFNKYMAKIDVLAGNIWSHMNTGASPLDAARGRMSQGIKLVQEGGFEGLYKAMFGPMADGEQLRKTYACYLSTSTGPVAGTLYISNLKFSFCSDRPLAYAPTPGQTAWSYYKMVMPLEKVKEVIPSFNETKPAEKYIQVVTNDGHDFWFMGFVNYDKGVKNLQLALKNIGVVDPNGGLKAPWAGMKVPGMKKTGNAAAPGQSPTSVPAGHVPTAGGPSPNYPPNQAPSTTNV
jgi:hypothetical protein